eukprot:m.254408 g.254408  ORF g.254408 m.254408 type:complete len:251 (+) comp18013_c0_seq1:114-866(+)
MDNTASKSPARPVIAAKLKGPGPGRYALPSTFGATNPDRTKKMSPAFSFGTRTIDRRGVETPGPHYVNPAMSRHGKAAGTAFSLTGRPKSSKKIASPGPGAYMPETAPPQRERRSPAFSMGSRTAIPKQTETPSPNKYSVPPALGKTVVAKQQSAPAHSIGMRHNVGSFANDNRKTPGPGTYNVTDAVKKKAPAFSMTGRTEMPGDKTSKPGPGAHSPEKVTMHKTRAPAFSMGVRHSEYTTPLIIDVPE